MELGRRWLAQVRSWAEWKTAKTQLIRPLFDVIVANRYKALLLFGLGFYFLVSGVVSHLSALLAAGLAFYSQRGTQLLIHDVCHNISLLYEKMSSFQNLASVEEMILKCDLLNVKLNCVLLIAVACLTWIVWVTCLHFKQSDGIADAPPRKDATAATVMAPTATDADDVTMSDSGFPTNMQPSS